MTDSLTTIPVLPYQIHSVVFAQADDDLIHAFVGNSGLTEAVQLRLTKKESWVRSHLAGSSGIADSVRNILADDPDW